MTRRVLFVISVVGLLGACGGTPPPAREITIELKGNRFQPETISMKAGERIRFVVTNKDSVDHEIVIGDDEVQTEHAEASGDKMVHHGTDQSTRAVPPGDTIEFDFTVPKTATGLKYGCHILDHYETGMVGQIDIT